MSRGEDEPIRRGDRDLYRLRTSVTAAAQSRVPAMLEGLSREDRMQLMRFVCSFAWADLEIRPEEREFIIKMITHLELDEDETAEVAEWLQVPPAADDLDPEDIPREHRKLFLDAARAMILSDGNVEDVEAENLIILDALLR